MNDPEGTDLPSPDAVPPEPPLAEPPRERYPFWGYGDLLIFIGLALPSLLAGAILVKAFVTVLRLGVRNRIFEIVPAQFVGYAILFGLLAALFRLHYSRPFWRSLGWVPSATSPARMVAAGIGLAFAVALASVVLRTPDVNSPMKEFLSTPGAVVLMAAFGTTLGPLCEELAFRGFMQPLFSRTFGPVPGIILAALPFGILHLQQYAWSWRHGLLITLAGAGFGWMRYVSGSTRAAVAMHMAYNCTFFVALVAQKTELPHTW
jgi:membrane protease YdiL (CAAX protease family)